MQYARFSYLCIIIVAHLIFCVQSQLLSSRMGGLELSRERSATRWYKSAGCDKQIYKLDRLELFTPLAPTAFTIIYSHLCIYNPRRGWKQSRGWVSRVIINTAVIVGRWFGKQRCESFKQIQTAINRVQITYSTLRQDDRRVTRHSHEKIPWQCSQGDKTGRKTMG